MLQSKNKVLHHKSQIALHAALLIGAAKPSKSVPSTFNSRQLHNDLKLGQNVSICEALYL